MFHFPPACRRPETLRPILMRASPSVGERSDSRRWSIASPCQDNIADGHHRRDREAPIVPMAHRHGQRQRGIPIKHHSRAVLQGAGVAAGGYSAARRGFRPSAACYHECQNGRRNHRLGKASPGHNGRAAALIDDGAVVADGIQATMWDYRVSFHCAVLWNRLIDHKVID
jgi:hypothetical protein